MKGRTPWIAIVLAVLCLLTPGASLLADGEQIPAGWWALFWEWLEETIAIFGPPAQPRPSAVTEPEAGILIPPGG